jgi:hypothetical protein
VTSVAVLFVVVAWACWMSSGRPLTAGAVKAFLIGAVAAVAAYDGVALAVQEYARAHDGRVMAGVVVEKISSSGAERSRRIREARWWRNGPIITVDGFKVHDVLARMILTGSPNAWIIEYRYTCEHPRGCRGRDFVPEALWRRLRQGQTINVRRSNGETDSSRLDENPRHGAAIADLAIAGTLLLAAALVSGRLTAPARRRYLTVPAVVTAIEPVTYRDVTRWRIRFAYFDPQGSAQEGVDELLTAAWKSCDACLAVFPPERPDLASFRALSDG